MSAAVIRIGHYRLGKTLGKGSFGKVKLAEHELTGHKVAVKIINRQKIKSSQMDKKIRREIKILKLFRHPHIIRLYEVIETATDIFMVMEYVSGGELFDYIVSRGRLSEDEARRFFQQIISGVEYCHRFMVVHRDLKPENLLLDSDYNVKIADFGLSNIMQDGDFLKTSCGSPNYAAPEVISGKLYAGPEVDVWSCGVILYALLCGRLPFDEENIPSLFRKIKEGSYTIPSHVSDLAKDLIKKILVVDPLARATIAEIRAHPWFQMNLPPYLALPPNHIEEENAQIDEEVLQEAVKKIGIDYALALDSIKKQEMNEITVAYFLLLDHKRRKMLSDPTYNWAERSRSPPRPILYDPTAPGAAPDISMEEMSSPLGSYLGGASLAGGPDVAMRDVLEPTISRHGSSSFWHLGIPVQCTASEAMAEVYRVLKELNMEWKVVGQFHLKAKYVDSAAEASSDTASKAASTTTASSGEPPAPPKSPSPLSSGTGAGSAPAPADDSHVIKLGLQLYKMPEAGYLLDLRKLGGDLFPFMDLCASFYSKFRAMAPQ